MSTEVYFTFGNYKEDPSSGEHLVVSRRNSTAEETKARTIEYVESRLGRICEKCGWVRFKLDGSAPPPCDCERATSRSDAGEEGK